MDLTVHNTVFLDIWWNMSNLVNKYVIVLQKWLKHDGDWDGDLSHKRNDFTILAKTSILDVWQGCEYSSELTSIFKDVLFWNQFKY